MIISIANQKGGVAKTTTAYAMASGLALRGYKTLVIDLDPQGNLSFNASVDNESKPTMYDVLKKSCKMIDMIQRSGNVDVAPANRFLAGVEQEITGVDKAFRLREALEPLKAAYDFIIIDTPPALGTLTVNAFTASDRLLIPSNAGAYSMQGIVGVMETVTSVKKYCNQTIEVSGILLTKFEPRSNIVKSMREIAENLSQEMHTRVYNTFIRKTTVVEEAQALQKDLFAYAPKATATQDYQSFIDEFLKEEGIA